MPKLEFPDGSATDLPEGEPIGAALDPEAVAARVDDQLVDLSFVPSGDARVSPVSSGRGGRAARAAALDGARHGPGRV